MAKTVEPSDTSRDSNTSHEAIKPKKLTDLIGKVANANTALEDARIRKSGLIQTAVDNDKLHSGAFAVFMKLRKMDAVKREAFRFHFEVYCEREWGKNADLLRTTGEAEEGEEDLRPRHLRQPGASAADAVKDLAAKTGATVTPIDSVGRGPQHKPDSKPH